MDMQRFIDSFSNRELTFLSWVGILLVWLMFSASFRKSLGALLRSLFWSTLTLYFLSVAVYTVSFAYFLWRNGWWDSSQLKNTLLWYFAVGAASLFEITNKKKSNYFKAALRDVLGFTAILQFIAGVYSFSFILEFLLLPTMVMVAAGAQVATQRGEKYEPVQKMLRRLTQLVGLAFIGYTIYRMVRDFSSFANEGVLSDFLLPALLTFGFLPFLYLLSIQITHDDVLSGLKRQLKDPAVRRYARWQALVHLHANKTDLNRWHRMLSMHSIDTKDGINQSIELLKQMKRWEKQPPLVAFETGWSPYTAKDFLLAEGIVTGFYHPVCGDEWMASSNYVKLEDGVSADTLAFYVEGVAQVATRLTLTLDVYDKNRDGFSAGRFFAAAEVLYRHALCAPLSDQLQAAIIEGKDITMQVGNRQLGIRKNQWEGHQTGGYSLRFNIEVTGNTVTHHL